MSFWRRQIYWRGSSLCTSAISPTWAFTTELTRFSFSHFLILSDCNLSAYLTRHLSQTLVVIGLQLLLWQSSLPISKVKHSTCQISQAEFTLTSTCRASLHCRHWRNGASKARGIPSCRNSQPSDSLGSSFSTYPHPQAQRCSYCFPLSTRSIPPICTA